MANNFKNFFVKQVLEGRFTNKLLLQSPDQFKEMCQRNDEIIMRKIRKIVTDIIMSASQLGLTQISISFTYLFEQIKQSTYVHPYLKNRNPSERWVKYVTMRLLQELAKYKPIFQIYSSDFDYFNASKAHFMIDWSDM